MVTSPASLNGSRLLRVLNDLAVVDLQVSHKNFAERLGQLIDLADSVNIARVHGRRGAETFEATTQSEEAITGEFLQVRNTLVSSIINSFEDRSGLRRIKLPTGSTELPLDSTSAYEPYGRFYAAHQREMAAKIQQLRSQVREATAGASPRLAQLATLDLTLGDTLASHSRRFLGTIPRLLGRHFTGLVDDYRQARNTAQENTANWPEIQDLFCHNMRGLLLAEVEARLLPTQGLIEALHSEIETTHHE